MDKIKLAVCQLLVGADKEDNLARAGAMIDRAAAGGASLVVLPEVFNAPYQASLFPEFAEPYPGRSSHFLSQSARANRICLVGGSIIERGSDGRLFNTSLVFDPAGNLIGIHRKVHLFDVEISGGISFKESDTLSPGDKITLVQYGEICFGLQICFDIRFPEMARSVVLRGANMLVVPAAFNMTTGPAHWDILMRTRAVDNQVFVVAASPARNPVSSYQAWGHSLVADPWGRILAQAGSGEEILSVELDMDLVQSVRGQLPLLKQRRSDVYGK